MAEYKNLVEYALHWERTTPERIFATQPMGGGDANVRTFTWRQFLDEARRMASYLVRLELPDHSQIAICSKNCVYWVMADLATWLAGHVSVPIFPTLTPDTVRYILEHSESKLLFVGKLDPIWEEMKRGIPDELPKVAFPLAPPNDYAQWHRIVAEHEPLREPRDRAPEEPATIIYTSGSTGRPKGVMSGFGPMLTATAGIARVIGSNPDDRYLSYLPIAHAMERWLAECVAFYSGGQLFFAETLDTFLHDLRRARPTLFMSVPRLWQRFQLGVFEKLPPERLARLLRIPLLSQLVKHKILRQLGLDQVRFAGSGSAPIPAELIVWYRQLGLELLEGYGMTENFSYSHVTRPGRVRPGFVGEPYDDVACRIADNGEVQVKSPGTMLGYFKQPTETQESFTDDGYLKTGDLGEIDEQGRLRVTGRIKEIFKTSKGKFISPAPIENLLLNHPRIELCCVGGAGFAQPFALVQLSEDARQQASGGGREALGRELVAHLVKVNESLLTFEKLQFLSVVDDVWLPENGFLTPTMKIKRARIEEVYGPFAASWYGRQQPVVWQRDA